MLMESAPLEYGAFARLPVHVQEDLLARADARAILANPEARRAHAQQQEQASALAKRERLKQAMQTLDRMR